MKNSVKVAVILCSLFGVQAMVYAAAEPVKSKTNGKKSLQIFKAHDRQTKRTLEFTKSKVGLFDENHLSDLKKNALKMGVGAYLLDSNPVTNTDKNIAAYFHEQKDTTVMVAKGPKKTLITVGVTAKNSAMLEQSATIDNVKLTLQQLANQLQVTLKLSTKDFEAEVAKNRKELHNEVDEELPVLIFLKPEGVFFQE